MLYHVGVQRVDLLPIVVHLAVAVRGGVDLKEAVKTCFLELLSNTASESIDQRLAVVEPGVVVFLRFLLLRGTSSRSKMS